MTSLSFGTMPHVDEFHAAVARECRNGVYVIAAGNCSDPAVRAAGGSYTAEELFELVESIKDDWQGCEEGDGGAMLASAIMQTLGFDWV